MGLAPMRCPAGGSTGRMVGPCPMAYSDDPGPNPEIGIGPR
ncbi:hypothetical protein [Azospirillum argentinense]